MDICKRYSDQTGMGKACEAIAKAYELWVIKLNWYMQNIFV